MKVLLPNLMLLTKTLLQLLVPRLLLQQGQASKARRKSSCCSKKCRRWTNQASMARL